MTRRRFRFALAFVGAASSLLAGCESWHPLGLRSKEASPAPSRLMTKADADEANQDEPGSTKGFFKPTRRSAALSSEAAEIEGSLGVGGR